MPCLPQDASDRLAGTSPASTGAYVGCVWGEYRELLEGTRAPASAAALTGTGLSFLAGRLSYTYGFQGPCVGMDTACSSSLVAAHLGHRALLDGEARASGGWVGVCWLPSCVDCLPVPVAPFPCTCFKHAGHLASPCVCSCLAAVSGGTNLLLAPGTSARLAQLGALASDGRSKTLDASVDGYGRGEACIVFVARLPSTSAVPPFAIMHGEVAVWLPSLLCARMHAGPGALAVAVLTLFPDHTPQARPSTRTGAAAA